MTGDEGALPRARERWWMARGDELLAGAALADDEQRPRRGRDGLRLREALAQGGGASDEAALEADEFLVVLRLLAEVLGLLAQAAVFADDLQELSRLLHAGGEVGQEVRVFLEEVDRAELHRLHGDARAGLRGEDDDGQVALAGLDLAQEPEAVVAAAAEVEVDDGEVDVRALALDDRDRGRSVAARGHAVTALAEEVAEVLQHLDLVVDYEYLLHE